MNTDPATLEVIRNAFTAISEEMNANLVRTGYSPNIKERQDCSCAVFDADGDMISQAENMPVHLGAMPFSVRAALERFPPRSLNPGDGIVLNDPFHGGAHLPDLTLVTPVYHDDSIIAFAANRAHHADVGGSQAGSVAANSTEIYQEGLRIPPVKLYRKGEINEDLLEMILTNVRTPDERRGDLRAQAAANETARKRVRILAEKYSRETLTGAIAEIQDYSERRMIAEIETLSNGTYTFEDVLDGDGQGTEQIAIRVTVTVSDNSILVDFEGTDPQTDGVLNAVSAVTTSATYYAIRCVTDPTIPPNEGCYRPVDINAPEETVVNAVPPAAVVGGNLEVSQRVTDVILGALADLVPDRATGAHQGTMNNITFGGTDPRTDRPYAFYETQGGGFGGRASGDGLDGVHVHMSNTMNTPAEILQTAYPLAVKRYEYRPDTGGDGEFRGGLGLRRDIEVRGHIPTFNLLAERRVSQPYGINGGSPGATGEDKLLRDDAEVSLDAKTTLELRDGDVISVRTPGGGGYGDPSDRDPDAVRRDIRLGKISPEEAREVYGVDVATTSELTEHEGNPLLDDGS